MKIEWHSYVPEYHGLFMNDKWVAGVMLHKGVWCPDVGSPFNNDMPTFYFMDDAKRYVLTLVSLS